MTLRTKQFHLGTLGRRFLTAAGFVVAIAGAYVGLTAAQGATAEAATTCYDKIYKQGSKSSCVKYMQIMLNSHEYLRSGGKPTIKLATDGVFGSKTTKAVKKLQKLYGLTQDGAVGKKTWHRLCNPQVGFSGGNQKEKAAVQDRYYNAMEAAGCFRGA